MPTAASGFEFVSRPQLRLGPGRIHELDELVARWGGTRVAVITDRVLAASQPLEVVTEVLAGGSAEVVVEASVVGEPTSASIDAAVGRLRPFRPDVFVGVGGGSSMDSAKVARSLVDAGAGDVEEYLGTGRTLPAPTSPLVLVPTTAGTGSEVNHFAVVEHLGRNQKLVLADPALAADVALVDAQLTESLPADVTAATGFDALTHAVEAFCSRLASPVTDLLAERAIGLVAAYLRRAHGDPDPQARAAMAEAATLAGIAFANAQLGLGHALSGPLGAKTHVAHGVANGLVLAPVLRFNQASLGARYAHLATLLTAEPATWVEELCADLGFPSRLGDVGLTGADLPVLARDAMASRQVQMNPRRVTEDDALQLLATIL